VEHDFMPRRFGCFCCVVACALVLSGRCAAENDIFESLVNRGVAVSPQETMRLPEPILADGFEASAQRAAIEAALGDRYSWETFTRKAVVSPILLTVSDSDEKSIGRRVDLCFVAYGSLDKFKVDDYFSGQLTFATEGRKGAEGSRAVVLAGDDLASRGLPAAKQVGEPRWVYAEFSVLDRVRVGATTRNVRTIRDDSVLIASVLDPKFDKDASYANTWRSISADDSGQRQMGKPQPYSGMGSYVKATRLVEPAGALFIEYHVVFSEPQEWFHGANLLRSKLPIAAQDMVRKLRRQLGQP
jgi:hypothetical protein